MEIGLEKIIEKRGLSNVGGLHKKGELGTLCQLCLLVSEDLLSVGERVDHYKGI